MPSENLLLIADSEKDADMLYATGIFVPDSRLVGAMGIWRVFHTAQAMGWGRGFTKLRASVRIRRPSSGPAQMVTVELGLYYRGIGGMRMEDGVLVSKGRLRNLN